MRGGLTRRVIGASALMTLLTSAAFVVLVLAISDQRRSAQLSRQSQEVLSAANQLERLLVDIETGTRGYLLTGEQEFLEPARAAEDNFDRASGHLIDLASDPDQNRTARAIKTKGDAYIQNYIRPLTEAASRNDPAATSESKAEEGRILIEDLRSDFALLEETESQIAAERDNRARKNANQATIAAISGLAGSVVLTAFFASYLSRAIVRPVRRGAEMAQQLADGNLSTRMPETGIAEIGVLEKAFNTMGESLQSNQAALARVLDEQAALRRVATLVAQENPPEKIFNAVSEEVGRLLAIDGTRLLRYETDGTATIVASWGQPAATHAGARVTLEGRSIASLVRRSGQAARIEDYRDANGSLATVLREHGVQSGVGAPITVEGRLWGAMNAYSLREDPLPADIEVRLARFTELVATAIANTQARADLTASRARVVAATDQIRRRIERDLHDGTQQRLVSISLDLRNAQASVPDTETELRTQLSEIGDGLVAALDDLREISRGIHPALLTRGGLNPALKALARRSSIPVELDINLGRLQDQIEVAAYYVVAEALTNAAKHAQPTTVWVSAAVEGGRLRLTVRDDGIGGADPGSGSGLTGLTDRVEALGGTITVDSPPEEGTTLQVRLPLTPPDDET
jgi:signal transduction histidine kinase